MKTPESETTMNASRDWRSLERHPLSAQYPDIIGRAWELYVQNLKENGIVGRRKITLYEGKVLDGWQLYRACLEVGIEPEFQELPEGISAEDYVETINDHRRHETQEQALQRAEARCQRVAAAWLDGQSLRAIAEDEDVSVTTVRNDLDRSGVQGCTPEKTTDPEGGIDPGDKGFGEEDGVTSTSPAPAGGKVKGRDGKTYPAKRLKAQGPGDPSPEADTPAAPALDPAVPARLRPYFEHVGLFEKAHRLALRLASLVGEVEQTPAYRKAVEGKKHHLYSTSFRTAARTLRSLTPWQPCPNCGGAYEPSPDSEPCKLCADKGYQTAEEADLPAEEEKHP
jgi:hypothetical protein